MENGPKLLTTSMLEELAEKCVVPNDSVLPKDLGNGLYRIGGCVYTGKKGKELYEKVLKEKMDEWEKNWVNSFNTPVMTINFSKDCNGNRDK